MEENYNLESVRKFQPSPQESYPPENSNKKIWIFIGIFIIIAIVASY
jgi:hypothetical protein